MTGLMPRLAQRQAVEEAAFPVEAPAIDAAASAARPTTTDEGTAAKRPHPIQARPQAAAAATAAIRHLKASSAEREGQQRAVRLTRERLEAEGLPVMATPTHILPVMIGDAEKCKAASDRLLAVHNIYIQPINYPTVPKGTDPATVTLERAVELLRAREDKLRSQGKDPRAKKSRGRRKR